MLGVGGPSCCKQSQWGVFAICSQDSEGRKAPRIKESGAATGPPSGCSKPPYENDCVRLLLKPNLDQSQPRAGGGLREWGAHLHEIELCVMWWANHWLHGNVNNSKWWNLSIYFPPFTRRMSVGAVNCCCDFPLGERQPSGQQTRNFAARIKFDRTEDASKRLMFNWRNISKHAKWVWLCGGFLQAGWLVWSFVGLTDGWLGLESRLITAEDFSNPNQPEMGLQKTAFRANVFIKV